MSLDKDINAVFEPVAGVASSVVFYSVPLIDGLDVKLILIWLSFAAVFFTIYLGFINLRLFPRAVKLLFGKGMETCKDGEISQFQALMASLSGTVGLGNISGVAIAISVGGPGAVFWMTVMGFLGMSSKFAEVMLGVKYRIHPDPMKHPHMVAGGPMYYLKEAFASRNMRGVGSFFAIMFAVFCVIGAIGGGNMYQANQAYKQVLVATGGDTSVLSNYGWAFGLLLSVLVGAVIIGGLKSIAGVASKLVPFMAGIYILSGLIVIGLNIGELPAAFSTIISMAFSTEAGLGGLLGGLLVGVQRAAFSNEAGLGSASIVQSTTNTDGPVGTGAVAMLGPFIDTIIICNITALVIVISGVYTQADGIAGVELTSLAFETGIPNFKYILTVAVLLFAYSTMISWYYCGAVCFRYLFGERDRIENLFKIFFCSCIVVGAAAELGNLINFADAAMMSMAIPNILGLYLFAPEIKRDVKEYMQRLKKSE
ncbi:MAG: alanine/glycine:cation symporter family protein [Alphaproteobacteria bacterium]